jgi:hypothetical protein
MLHLRREAVKIRQDLDRLDMAVQRTEGFQDCAETNEREIRAIRTLIFEAAQAYDAMLRHFDGTIYMGLTEEQKEIPLRNDYSDLNACRECRAFHLAAMGRHHTTG